MKKKIILIIKIILSIIILYYLINKIDFSEFKNFDLTFKKIIYLIIAVLIAFFSNYFLSVLKWKYILQKFLIHKNFMFLVKIYVVGIFYNTFLPGIIGGDVVKSYYISKNNNKKLESIYSIFLDRLIGFFTLNLLSLFSLFFLINTEIIKKNIELYFIIIISILILSIILFRPLFFLKKLLKFLPKKINDKFIEIDKKTFRFFKTKKYILKIFLISFAFQIVQVIFYIFLGLFLGIDLNVYKYFFVVIPLSLLFSSLPVTFGNLGFRESVLIFFLTAIPGVESSYAFVLGVLVYGVKIVMGIPGLYLIIYKKINRRHIL